MWANCRNHDTRRGPRAEADERTVTRKAANLSHRAQTCRRTVPKTGPMGSALLEGPSDNCLLFASGATPAPEQEGAPAMTEKHATIGKLIELDSLRGFMALWVYVTHALFIVGVGKGGVMALVANGSMAVSIFMILSGFAIASSLLASPSSYGHYMARRFFRIYPIYLVGLLLGMMTSWLYPGLLQSLGWADPADVARIAARTQGEAHAFWPHLLAHLTLLHGAIPDALLYGSALSFNGPAWSLSLEMQFYLLAPLLVVLLREPARRPMAFGAVVLLALAGSVLFKRFYLQVPSFLPISLIYFLFGILTAIHLPRLAARPHILLALGAMLVLLAARTGQILFALPIAVWSAIILICSLDDWPLLARLRSLLAWRPFVAMGESSYGFYILHLPIMIAWAAFLERQGMGGNRMQFGIALLASLPVTLVIAHYSYRLFEAPINAWAKQRFRDARERPSARIGGQALEGA
jgi:peptidoglycan/LPS O-acetylase OafA/YrhL